MSMHAQKAPEFLDCLTLVGSPAGGDLPTDVSAQASLVTSAAYQVTTEEISRRHQRKFALAFLDQACSLVSRRRLGA